jgi:cellulose synthase/poly-beta-1,6-N-acetylglucosamine synthase-like glycosyltransferase
MAWLVGTALVGLHLFVGVPVVMFFLQSLLARRHAQPRGPEAQPSATSDPSRGRIVALVPAHNERLGIRNTIESVRAQLRPGDAVLVVADNCSDDTATVARSLGATCIERHDADRRGKGYALAFGVDHLRQDPPALVFMCDADCVVAPGSIDRLAQTCLQVQRPVQALDLMKARPGASLAQRFNEFAWRVKNQVRPLGAMAMGAPCQLMGTGMMFEWRWISTVPLASGHLAEDMQMGVNLALRGAWPQFEPRALVTSLFPLTDDAAQGQKKRWEHGHLATLRGAVPKLIWQGLLRGKPTLVAMGLDLTIPPLALLLTLMVGLAAVDLGIGWWFDTWIPLALALGLMALFGVALVKAWWQFGQGTLTGRELAMAPWLALRKIPLYVGYLVKGKTSWTRARRDDETHD